MLVSEYFYLNPTFEKYGIEDITSKSDFEVERYLAAHKVQSPQFIILPEYVITNTINKVFLNDTSSCPPSSGQPACNCIISRPKQNISCKRTTIIDVDRDTTITGSETKKKAKKLMKGEQIASEMSKQIL